MSDVDNSNSNFDTTVSGLNDAICKLEDTLLKHGDNIRVLHGFHQHLRDIALFIIETEETYEFSEPEITNYTERIGQIRNRLEELKILHEQKLQKVRSELITEVGKLNFYLKCWMNDLEEK